MVFNITGLCNHSHIVVSYHHPLTIPSPCISESCSIKVKIKLYFYFHTSLWCFKRFYEGLNGLSSHFSRSHAPDICWLKNSQKYEKLLMLSVAFCFQLKSPSWIWKLRKRFRVRAQAMKLTNKVILPKYGFIRLCNFSGFFVVQQKVTHVEFLKMDANFLEKARMH